MKELRITILDHDLDRILACEKSVRMAIKDLGLSADVTQVSEPPYLSRLDVWERLPALEINGRIWSRPSRNAFTTEEVVTLLRNHIM